MNTLKDELVTAAELARRLNMNRSFISKNKNRLIDARCTYGKKFYYRKSALLLGRNPNNPHQTYQSKIQQKEETPQKSKKEIPEPKKEIINKEEIENIIKSDSKDLLAEIEATLKDKDTVYDKALLDGLKAKAAITKTYYEAENEKIKNRKLEADLFERDEVIKILSFAMSMIRNSLINSPNNYAVSLEGMNQKEIKDYVTDDINRILEDLQNVGNQF